MSSAIIENPGEFEGLAASQEAPAHEMASPTNGLPIDPATQIENARQLLVSELHPHVPSEASLLLFDAGYETVDAVRSLNVNMTDPNNDLVSAEFYTKRTLKPGHRKLIIQYVTNPPFNGDPNDPANMSTPGSGNRKRRRLHDETGSPLMIPTPDLPTLLTSLERHLSESPVTRTLRKEADYRVGVEHSRDGRGAEGVWKCLVCNSRPVTISLRNGGRQPQLSNVGTHLKTVKHTTALHQRNSGQFLTAATGGTPEMHSTSAAAAAHAAAMAVANTYQHHPSQVPGTPAAPQTPTPHQHHANSHAVSPHTQEVR